MEAVWTSATAPICGSVVEPQTARIRALDLLPGNVAVRVSLSPLQSDGLSHIDLAMVRANGVPPVIVVEMAGAPGAQICDDETHIGDAIEA